MFPLGDGQPPRIMPSDNTARLNGGTEHRRENAERPTQYRPHVSRWRAMLDRFTRR